MVKSLYIILHYKVRQVEAIGLALSLLVLQLYPNSTRIFRGNYAISRIQSMSYSKVLRDRVVKDLNKNTSKGYISIYKI